MARIWLVRHGETAAAPSAAVGWSDPPLSEAGRVQARRLAQRLSRLRLGAVYASDLRRAMQTAAPIAARHSLEVVPDRRLRELDFGRWEGRDLSDLWVEEPAAAAAWERDITRVPASFGESFAELEARVAAFWREASAGAAAGVAVVAHGGSLAVLRALLTGAGTAATVGSRQELGSALRVTQPRREARAVSTVPRSAGRGAATLM